MRPFAFSHDCIFRFCISFIELESLHDHETFTEMLMLILHLKEELDMRDYESLTETEKLHLTHDMEALYRYLTYEWCHYLNYLSKNYPGLFSTAIMLSPFNKKHQRQALEDHKGGAC